MLNIDERLIEAAITPRTKSIYDVHHAGDGCAMDHIGGFRGRDEWRARFAEDDIVVAIAGASLRSGDYLPSGR